jgi:hypothetical protein
MWPDSRDIAEQEDDQFDEVTTTGEYLTVLVTLVLVLMLFLVAGCVNAPVAPNLKLPEAQPACPKLALPPIPQKLTLEIEGDKILYDEGGESMLRGYVRARQLLR